MTRKSAIEVVTYEGVSGDVVRDVEWETLADRRRGPRFTRALGAGMPRRPREYRRTPALLLLTVGLAVLSAGLVLAHGLLIAAGLVLAGMAGELLDSFPPDR
ncbi:hypothetical protein AB0C88_40715 [Streptomyces chartreusis]|uniref:hypothetical protein n=1 Tax=Streptomyces chartreusis TaxID=1969 RepID=UPI0033DC8546